MNNFTVDGVYYQIRNSNTKTIRVGTGNKSVDQNAVVGAIPKKLRIIETYELNNEIYHVEEIAYNAFRSCKQLSTVYVPDSVLA